MSLIKKVRGEWNRRGPSPYLLLTLLVLSLVVINLSGCVKGSGTGQNTPLNSPKGQQITVPDDNARPETAESDEKAVVGGSEAPISQERVGEEQQPQDETELREGKQGIRKIALTFDAGASAKPTPALLAVLAERGVHATFFLTGKWVEQNQELTRQIVASGHEVGNHTFSHYDLRNLSDEEINDELSKTDELVKSVAGISTKPYFRPPFGGRNDRVLRVAAEAGYKCVYWSADSWDGFKKGIRSDEIEKRVLDRAKDGAIVLMHCGSQPTVDALPHIINELRSRGYELVKVSELE